MLSPQPTFICVGKAYEVRHWARTLHCTVEELLAAVAVVGNEVEALKRHLGEEALWRPSDIQQLDEASFFSKRRTNTRLSGFLRRSAGGV